MTDPPVGDGMATIEVDTNGKLFGLAAPSRSTAATHADWNKLLRLTAFDASALTRTRRPASTWER